MKYPPEVVARALRELTDAQEALRDAAVLFAATPTGHREYSVREVGLLRAARVYHAAQRVYDDALEWS